MFKYLFVIFVGITLGAFGLFAFQSLSQSSPHITKNTNIKLGDQAPNFTAVTTSGRFDFHNWVGKNWAILFSHPKAFTPVCSTELGVLALFKKEFAKRNTKIIALSVDTLDAQMEWVKQINSTQMAQIDFPLIADPSREVASLYGMVDSHSNDEFTIRSVFIIDPLKRVRLKITYPATTGRNFSEILRVLDSLQLADQKHVTTPANWTPGEKVVIPVELKDEQTASLFSSVETVLPYLRLGKMKE